MIIEILIAPAVVVGALVIFIANRPSAFRVSRSATIPVSASVLFAEVNNLHRWEAWSPWARLDPQTRNTYTGAESGVGSVFRWEGKTVGEGIMTILESHPDKLVRIKLEFLKPFQATNSAEFTFEPKGDQTVVTWSMSGTNSFLGKAMSLVMNCEKMCGGMFEKGLDNLKAVTKEMLVHQSTT